MLCPYKFFFFTINNFIALPHQIKKPGFLEKPGFWVMDGKTGFLGYG